MKLFFIILLAILVGKFIEKKVVPYLIYLWNGIRFILGHEFGYDYENDNDWLINKEEGRIYYKRFRAKIMFNGNYLFVKYFKKKTISLEQYKLYKK